jgi:outer membrane receptor for ferric coprogen and ferric-rhodotorulic acid
MRNGVADYLRGAGTMAAKRIVGGGRRRALRRAIMLTALAAAIPAGEILAQTVAPGAAQPGQQIRFDIPGQPLVEALIQFGRQAGLQVSADNALIQNRRTAGVNGVMTREQALTALLAGTGLSYRINGSMVALESPSAAPGAITLHTVTIEGARPALDPGRTEGTGSYAGSQVTIGAKTPTSIRETPQSISVITRQRIEDQYFRSLDDAMKQTTGMITRPASSGSASIFSRGHEVDTMMLDGIAMPALGGNFPTGLDLAVYDRIEALRGPAGLFQGAGEPGASINLVRKRARDQFAMSGMAGVGSWDFYRTEADITGPLDESGRLRGRAVGVYEDRQFFYDVAEQQKPLVYGTLELDVTEVTTLSVGATRQRIDQTTFNGIPAYATGRFPDVDRSTFIGADWNNAKLDTTDTFVELEHRLENDGHLKLSARYLDRTNDRLMGYPDQAINPVTNDATLFTFRSDLEQETVSLDAYVSTPLSALGQTHNFVLGMDYRQIETEELSGNGPNFLQNVFAPNHAIPKPYIPFTRHTTQVQEQYGAYGQLRYKPIGWGTVVLGGRMSWLDQLNRNEITNVATANYSVEHEFTPYAAVIADVSDTISLYASYAEIFKPQSQMTASGGIIKPRIGDQVEVGVKGEFLDGKLNAHVAAFRIQDQNRAIPDPSNSQFSIAAGEVDSRGIETEVTGQLTPAWGVAAGYAFTQSEFVQGTAAQTGTTFSTITPKHIFNLWTRYSFDAGEPSGVDIGGGVRAVSDFYNRSGNVRFEQGSYVVATAQVGYRFSEKIGAYLTVDNVFDEHYFERVSAATDGNYFGAPRSFWLTVRASW